MTTSDGKILEAFAIAGHRATRIDAVRCIPSLQRRKREVA
jgi:hypothetical protein